ncbi:MAG: hypothetical protein HPY55_00050 [Firmicutes bacterium]|nr:hypothetical protein [Bacillota bacterium]
MANCASRMTAKPTMTAYRSEGSFTKAFVYTTRYVRKEAPASARRGERG